MWSEALEMLARAQRLHKHVFRPNRLEQRRPSWEPPVDVLETPTEVIVFDRPAGLYSRGDHDHDRKRFSRHFRRAKASREPQ